MEIPYRRCERCGKLHKGKGCAKRTRWQSCHLYNTTMWKGKNGMREQQLLSQPSCEKCLERGIYVAATTADHLYRHNCDESLFMSIPLTSLCHSCHSIKTAQGE